MNLESISRRTLLTALASASLLVGGVTRAAGQGEPFPLLVDLDWLRAHSSGPNLRLLDVSPLHVYRNRHIDSASHAWWRDTVDPNYPVFGAVLTQGEEEAHRQRVLDSLDLRTGDRVVVYDNENGLRAARLVWFLRFLGFGQVALLDADFASWKAEEFPIQSASTSSTSPKVNPQPGYYLVTEQLRSRLEKADVQIVDIRTDAERRDDLGGNMPLGQIPGSTHFPWNTLLGHSGRLIGASELQSLTSSLGLDPALETVLYGSFGVDTALSWLALRNAGFAQVLSYDRGWAEWSTGSELHREPLP